MVAVAVLAGCTGANPRSAAPAQSPRAGRPAGSAAIAPGVVAVSSGPAVSAPAGATPDDRMPGWAARENRRSGTTAWKITAQNALGLIEGYARTTSATPGTTVALYVNTIAPTFTVQAYRMGWYGGAEGRLVWTSPVTPGAPQPPAGPDPITGLVEARWTPTLQLPVGTDWLPGAYLLKLVSSLGDQSYIPLTVRDDGASAEMTIVDAVSTWQAYNPWGGCSLYKCYVPHAPSRAVKVSFDRPYLRTWHGGSADFLDHELPLISLAEQQGYDLAYVTSLDVQHRPALLATTHAVLSMGHDEYYSSVMREAVAAARDQGVNLAFFGANAIYRHVRFEAAADGVPDRVEVNYRERPDPIGRTDPAETTTEWRVQRLPEAPIVGIQYGCANLDADLVVADSTSWVWHDAGVSNGEHLQKIIGTEADVATAQSPANLDLLSASPITCRGRRETARTSYYAAPSGAGVFASGTIWWVCAIEAVYCSTVGNTRAVRAATRNVLAAFARGPAGVVHPSGRGSSNPIQGRPPTACCAKKPSGTSGM